MSDPVFDVVAIGNALVDVLCQVDDDFIASESASNGMHKGSMNLIDEPRAVELYAKMQNSKESSGGSAANTMAGFASFGGKGGFIGKVSDDELGKVFRDDLQSLGVVHKTQPLILGASTGRCLVLVTSDAERTMNTFLGASTELSMVDIEEDSDMIASAKVTYLEGYLFDPPHAKDAFKLASKYAHDAGHRVALTLSDPFCVERHRADFLDLVQNHVDILFANEEELMSLYETHSFEDAFEQVRDKCEILCLTRGSKGSLLKRGDEIVEVPVEPVPGLIDTTGAGDQYAAGFLYGFSREMSLAQCGKLAALAAAEVICHIGPRPEITYADFLKQVA